MQPVHKKITGNVEDCNPSCSTLLAETQNFFKGNNSLAASQLFVKVLSNSNCTDNHSNCVQNAFDNLIKIFCESKKNKGSYILIKTIVIANVS